MHSVHRRQVDRRVLPTPNTLDPEVAVGQLRPGMEVFALHKGQFGLMRLTEYVLTQTGPADVLISSWAVASSDLDSARKLLDQENLRSCTWLVDRSFPGRQPAYARMLVARFGRGSLIVGKVHAKVVMVRNDDWNIVIRSSMNISPNHQVEFWELSDSPALADYVQSIADRAREVNLAMEERQVQRASISCTPPTREQVTYGQTVFSGRFGGRAMGPADPRVRGGAGGAKG